MEKDTWLVFYSGDIKEIEAVEEIAAQVPQVELFVVEGSQILNGRVLMPFIATEKEERYYGLPSIIKYAKSLSSVTFPHSKWEHKDINHLQEEK